jgi:malonyl-CoA decarboxylase
LELSRKSYLVLEESRDKGIFRGLSFALLDAAEFCGWTEDVRRCLKDGHEILTSFPGQAADIWRDFAVLLPAYRGMIEGQLRGALDAQAFADAMNEATGTLRNGRFVVELPEQAFKVLQPGSPEAGIDAVQKMRLENAMSAFGAGDVVLAEMATGARTTAENTEKDDRPATTEGKHTARPKPSSRGHDGSLNKRDVDPATSERASEPEESVQGESASTEMPVELERKPSPDRTFSGVLDGVFSRTLANLRSTWGEIALSARGVLTGSPRPDLPEDDVARLREQMLSCLDGRGGEVTARARAAELGRTYLKLNEAGRERFLRMLGSEFDTDDAAVVGCTEALNRATDHAERRAAQRALRAALIPPRITLLRQFNALPEGVKFLVDRRAELLAIANGDPILRGLADDLRDLFASWFDMGFLELRRITWETPALLLEKLIAYEAPREIRGWTDLKNRLEDDRRCFAFFHPRMPDEPLIFVEVALLSGMAGDIGALIDETAPIISQQAANTAIFYSISLCQRGLVGISFGDFLIKRIVDALAAELPRIKTFATLSPVPGFRAWLKTELERSALLHPREIKAVETVSGSIGPLGADHALLELLDRPKWVEDAKIVAALRQPLLRLAARYLLSARAPSGRALDPVAHFHLSNGARIEQLDWLGDRSPKGLQQSAGIMVNYAYRYGDIEANHEAYRDEGRLAASWAVRRLARLRDWSSLA